MTRSEMRIIDIKLSDKHKIISKFYALLLVVCDLLYLYLYQSFKSENKEK